MKRILKYFIFVILCNLIFINIYAEEVDLASKNAVLYNMNEDNIIYEKNKEEVISIASLTKIMTIIVAIENNPDLNKKITITTDAFKDTYSLALAGFKVGEEVTIKDLLYGAMLPSGADACNMLAVLTAKDNTSFVKLMNEKAKLLGLKNTHFVNVTGIDAKNHYSTVEDVSILLKYALENKEFKSIYTTKEYTTTNNLKLKSTLKKTSEKYNLNTNFIQGSKTGHTTNAGLCMSSISNLNKVNYLLVTCNASSKDEIPYNITDSMKIYKYFSENYDYLDLIKKGDKVTSINIKDGKKDKYIIISPKTIRKYMKKDDKENISVEYKGIKTITKKIKKGDKLGKIIVKDNNKTIEKIDIYLNENIKYKLFTIKNIIIFLVITLVITLIIKLFKSNKLTFQTK